MQRTMDRSDAEILEYYMESTLMDRRKKSCTFPKELLDLCDKEDLDEYDKQIDDEERENEEVDEAKVEKKNILERAIQNMKKKEYNLRKRKHQGDGDDQEAIYNNKRRLVAEEAMDTN